MTVARRSRRRRGNPASTDAVRPPLASIAHRTFAALRFRNYRLYLASQLISFSGTWMQQLAQSWLVLELTGSGTALGGVLAFQFLPMLILAPVGGLVADRLDKRRLIAATQSAAGSVALCLGILTIWGAVELWMVYALATVLGAVTALDNPARQTFVSEMVGAAHLANAITLNSVTINTARAVGPAVGGVLIATMGIGPCFMVNAASYLVVVVSMQLIDGTKLHPTPRAVRARGQLRQGLRYAWDHPRLRTTLVMVAVVGLFLFEFPVTFPLLADQTFDVGASGLAVMEALFGMGAVGGGLFVASRGTPTLQRFVKLTLCGSVLALVLAVAPVVFVAYATVPFLGAAMIATLVAANALLQVTAEPHLRGRVIALFAMAVLGTTPIGAPLVGWIGEYVDPRAAVAVGGIAGIAAAGYGMARLRQQAAMERDDQLSPCESAALS